MHTLQYMYHEFRAYCVADQNRETCSAHSENMAYPMAPKPLHDAIGSGPTGGEFVLIGSPLTALMRLCVLGGCGSGTPM